MKVGFLINFPEDYKGGLNYYKNLFFAINKHYGSLVQIFVFVPTNFSKRTVSVFEPYSKVIYTRILERFSMLWFISKLFNKYFKFDFPMQQLFANYGIDVVCFCCSFHFLRSKIKTINWIPDFQSIHLPSLWTKKQLKEESKNLKLVLKKSDRIVVSSNDSLKDLISAYSISKDKIYVIHFVSQPYSIIKENKSAIFKYTLDPYFYLPNQFWEHKNHMIVFRAVNELRKKNINIKLLCSGMMHDFRGRNAHLENISRYIKDNKLEDSIKLLGVIEYSDVFNLISFSLAVINPSFFEGWSSTVEEAKTMGKKVILSDIPVHREQNPKNGYYFNPSNYFELALIMEKILVQNVDEKFDEKFDFDLLDDLNSRTYDFACDYFNVLQLVTDSKL
jgi:glycosyltransferase involved in cell wall biosynthesis